MKRSLIVILLSLIAPGSSANDCLHYFGVDIGHHSSGITTTKLYPAKTFNTTSFTRDPAPNNNVPQVVDNPLPNQDIPNDTPTIRDYYQHTKHESQFINLYSGYKLSDFLSFEVGVYQNHIFNSLKSNKHGKSKLFGIHYGLMLFIPVTENTKIISGFSLMNSCLQVYKPGEIDSVFLRITPRFTFGSQYKINDRFNIRGSIVLNKTGKLKRGDTRLNNAVNFGLGFNYNYMAD